MKWNRRYKRNVVPYITSRCIRSVGFAWLFRILWLLCPWELVGSKLFNGMVKNKNTTLQRKHGRGSKLLLAGLHVDWSRVLSGRKIDWSEIIIGDDLWFVSFSKIKNGSTKTFTFHTKIAYNEKDQFDVWYFTKNEQYWLVLILNLISEWIKVLAAGKCEMWAF